MTTQDNLLLELLVEELPPKALQNLSQSFAKLVFKQLQAQALTTPESRTTVFATPRRLGVHVTHILSQAPARQLREKLMPTSVGLDSDGQARPPLLKKLATLGMDASVVPQLTHAQDGKTEMLFYEHSAEGVRLEQGLQQALAEAIHHLPIPKVMSYQLDSNTALPGWDSVQFVRPAHGLLALHGEHVVAVSILGLTADRCTQGHRFEALQQPLKIPHADAYEQILHEQGAVLARFETRRQQIEKGLQSAAAQIGNGLHMAADAALLDEVTALVERPQVLACRFETDFLHVPAECLILTMKANQKYFPLLDAQNQLTEHFLVVSNISPADPTAVIEGNERVVRARLSDARFFYDQDRMQSLQSRLPALEQVVYHQQLGSQAERSQRVERTAGQIARLLQNEALIEPAQSAARLAKADLLTEMVGEFPELQGVMGRYYATHDGWPSEVAEAIEDHYKPRFAGDELPRGQVGTLVALADKLETLVGLFGIGQLPTGDKDPFALRRHALGVIRLLIEKQLPLELSALLAAAWPQDGLIHLAQNASPTRLDADTLPKIRHFMDERLAHYLQDAGYASREVQAVIALQPELLASLPKRLDAVRRFAQLPESEALAAANKRIGQILKKSDTDTLQDLSVQELLLQEEAELALYQAMQEILPRADRQFEAGEYAASLQTLAALRQDVDTFFDQVMVNAEQTDLRNNRLALLKILHQAMNRVADLSQLA